MMTLNKKDVDNYVQSGDTYERLGEVIGSLQVRDKKFMKREPFEKDKDQNHTLSSWLLNYVPSLRNFVHKNDGNKVIADMNEEEKQAWDNWKKMSTAIAFGHEKIKIIG